MRKLLLTVICSAPLFLIGCGDDKNDTQAQQPTQQPSAVTANTEVKAEVKAMPAQTVSTEAVSTEGAAPSEAVYKEGSDYTILENKIDLGVNAPHVIQFFWFGCIHCQKFEPTVEAWHKANNNVILVRIPAVTKYWKRDAQIFYTMADMGIMDSTFKETFRLYEHNSNSRRKALTFEELLTHFKGLGIDTKEFTKIYNSSAVAEKVEIAEAVFNYSQVSGVPGFIVNGTHLISLENINNHEDLTAVIDALL